uniref:RING-type domain-containing protein n=1 Tax=Neolamprologus brichardi TaxID=32507 RepID=A0A3Q4HML9_NEOBR
MSLPAAFLSEDQFTCSICLEVFNKPVTTPCGHSFCQTCISSYWDGNSTKMYQCPLCKESFLKRPTPGCLRVEMVLPLSGRSITTPHHLTPGTEIY